VTETPEPPADPEPTILVPIDVHGEAVLPSGTAALLANARVVLLGYHEIPEQTATEQAREQLGEPAMATLERLGETLTDAGVTVETRLVFTHEATTTIDRIIYEHDCLAVLLANAVPHVENVLLAVRGLVGLDRNTALVAGLFADRGVDVTVYHGRGADESAAEARGVVTETERALVDHGMEHGGRGDGRAGGGDRPAGGRPRRRGDGRDEPVGDDGRLRDARRPRRRGVPGAGARRAAAASRDVKRELPVCETTEEAVRPRRPLPVPHGG